MKKFIVCASFLLALSSLSAQTTNAMPASTNVQPPSGVSTRFNNDYPNMQPTWTMDGSNYRADYADGSNSRSVIYDPKGKMMSREEMLSNGTYPSTIGDYYTKTYPNEKYEVWSSTDTEGNMTYYTKRNSETVLFDKSGNYKKTTKTKTVKK
jgi:hypothetical protein